MDILNFISWIKGKRQVTSVDPAKTLLPVGLKDGRRDDEYIAGAISVEDFATQVGGLQTVAVDGTTIVGDGTPSNPLVANIPSSANIYTSDGTLTGSRILQGADYDLTFQGINRVSLDTFKNNKRYVIDNLSNNYINLSYFNLSTSVGNGIRLQEQEIKTYSNGFNNITGLKLDFANRVYELGQITGNNTTTLTIDDAATYPVQVKGTNVTANTAGGASSEFLKIKVNGVDYKIALLNP